MKKRLTAALLCVLMILPVSLLTSCGGGGRSTYTQKTPVTLTLYTITDEKTTEDGIKAAQVAINDFTEVNFGTHVELRMFTADEYAEVLDARIQAMADASGEAPVVTTAAEEEADAADDTAEETQKSEETKVYRKREDVVYPKAGDNQVDIFLVSNIDMFNTYCAAGMLRPIDDYLAGTYTVLNKYLNPYLMQASKFLATGMHYAVPNNHMVGEYEYILLNKEIVDSFGYYPDDIHTILQLNDYVTDVTAHAAGYTPVIDTYGIKPLAVTLDGAGDFFGAYIGHGASGDTSAMPKSILGNGKFQNEFTTLRELRKSGKMINGEMPAPGTAAQTKAAAILVKGDINLPELYADEYYASVYKYPTATNDNTYNSMYGICAYTKNADRCMEIISALQTDEKFRNIFQYGKKNEDYEINNKTGLIDIINREYVMDPLYTGNQFILTPNSDMTDAELALAADKWKAAKEQNKYIAASPYFGFSPLSTVAAFDDPTTMTEAPKTAEDMLADIKKLSDDFNSRIDSFNGDSEALKALMSTMNDEMKDNKSVKNAGKTIFTNSPLALYNAWYKMMYKPEEAPAPTTTAAAADSAAPAETSANE